MTKKVSGIPSKEGYACKIEERLMGKMNKNVKFAFSAGQIVALKNEGYSYSEIASKINLAESSVRHIYLSYKDRLDL